MILAAQLCGQKTAPAAVANTYILTDNDGFPGFNYAYWKYLPSGKIYAKDFFGKLHITGNNFIKQIPGITNLTHSTGLMLQPNNELWLYDEYANITIIQNDSLRKTVKNSKINSINLYNNFTNELYILAFKPDSLMLYKFQKYSWKKVHQVKRPEHFRPENIHARADNEGRIMLFTHTTDEKFRIYEMNPQLPQLQYLSTTPATWVNNCYPFFFNQQLLPDTNLLISINQLINQRTGKKLPLIPDSFNKNRVIPFGNNEFTIIYGNGLYEYFTIDSNRHIKPESISFESKDKSEFQITNPAYPYLTFLTGNKPFRLFPYVKKYPRIFNGNNANNIFAVTEDDQGRIWAGSYQNDLAVINPRQNKVNTLPQQSFAFMNATLNYNGNVYLVGESASGGLLQYNPAGKMRQLPQPAQATGYFLYLAPRSQKIYYPSSAPGFPVFYCHANELEKTTINWKKLDSSSGIAPFGMASMVEDTTGRIWMGHPVKGFAVYDPAAGKAKSYDARLGESPIGFVSSIVDHKGTVWMGSDSHGLWYYNNYNQPATPQHIQKINHPLLDATERITAMSIYKNWLVLGCYDKICLLNLDSFYLNNKTILRYLNPQEAALTSLTEQNTMLTSKSDSSIWFSTSDMLYQWNIKTWFNLPVYKVKMNTSVRYDSINLEMNADKELRLSPQIRGFDIVFEYLSPDALPRYTRTALIREGDSVVFSQPGVQSRLSCKNLSSGSYQFLIEIFEQDGTTSQYSYRFIITRYIWQQGWFWMLLSFLFLTPVAFWLNLRRKKAQQQKEISLLNVVTLSNQFRPHFILNALNAIGADLKDKPGAESILSRLGESINLIFNHAQQKKVSHSLVNEWTLIENVLQIHRIIYLPGLEVRFSGIGLLEEFKNFQVPLGILETHVENALLHGLRNKKEPPYQLEIGIEQKKECLYFTIKDNGIGREAAMRISSYKKHGTGISNMRRIIAVLNQFNKNKIEINFLANSNGEGTTVRVKMPLQFHYQY